MKAHHIFAVVTAFCIFNMASASEGGIDRERMQQDLEIMEGILQSLHAQTTSNLAGIHREPQIRGLYFENYGVIFHIEEKRSSGMVVDVDVRRLREKPAGVTEELEEEDFLKEVSEQRKKKRVGVQERLVEFLGTYADGIRQLMDEDRITILVHQQPRSRAQIAVPDKRLQAELSEPVYSEATAKKSDIVAYRRERIAEAEFRKRIVSREHKPDASMMKKIGVMATILDKALKQPEHPVSNYNKTLGIYQKGLGALFFVNAKSGYRTAYRLKLRKTPKTAPFRIRAGRAVKAGNPLEERFKEELIEVVGDYGYSLRTLKPEEYIVVEVRFPRRPGRRSSGARGLLLTVKKKNVDAYSRGDLDLAAFRQKVDILEY